MNDLRDTVLTIFMAALLTMPWAYSMLAARTTYYVESVTTIRLVGLFELDYYDNIVQPVRTFVLACPRMDMIRLWPLPVEQPWFEDNGMWKY